jgi:two-component system, NtrC family, sensor kinase
VSPRATQRLRRGTAAVAVLWALSALFLAIWGQVAARHAFETPIRTSYLGGFVLVSAVTPEGDAAGVERGQRVLSVDGVPIREWYRSRGWQRLSADVPLRYRIEGRGGVVREVSLLPVARRSFYQQFLVPTFGAVSLVGLAFLFVGVLVWRLKPDRAESWAFLLFSSCMATTLFSSVLTYDAPAGYERLLMNLPLIGATALHLFTVFPSEPPWVARHRRLRVVPYAIAAAVAGLVLLERFTALRVPGLQSASFALALLGALLAVGILVRERIRMRGSPQAVSADIVLVAVTLSLLPVVLLMVLQLFLPMTLPIAAALVWFIAFPVGVAWGILRGQLFDARGLARSSAAYGAATLAITGLFAFLITFADAAFARWNVNASSPFFSVVFLFFAILAFNPLRNRLQSLVDRLFDRDRAGYREAVRNISEAMVSMLSLSEIGERLVLALTGSMGVERAMVLLLDEAARSFRPAAWRGTWDEDATDFSLPLDHTIAKHLWMRRQELTRADFDDTTDPETRELCWDVYDALDVRLLVPILFGVDLLGVIAVGPKLSGERIGPDDRQLLRTLANQSAIAIENAQAFDEIAKLNETLEARVDERTRELRQTQAQLMQSEKMRSLGQLVAGVAHELNNPIGFVHANLQLLDGYIERLVEAQLRGGEVDRPRDAIEKLLLRSREGTERVKKIVQDLRTFSRMDQAELADVDLNQELQSTLGLMEPRFKDGIRLAADLGELPRVRCYPAQLNQVFMNLLMNACDAVGEGGTVSVRTRAAPGGVALEFVDDGPGIPDFVRERIFEPFFTTKPVGQGTGLGLSISHGIVERHGGKLSVNCPPEGGTVFRVELPLVAAPPAE